MSVQNKALSSPTSPAPEGTKLNQDALAAVLAQSHFKTNFQRWWFVGALEEDALVYLSNCAPHSGGPSVRDEQLCAIAEEAADIGLVQVGRAVYPTKGEDAGYAVVVIFGCEEGHLDNLSPDERVKEVLELQADLGRICEEYLSWE